MSLVRVIGMPGTCVGVCVWVCAGGAGPFKGSEVTARGERGVVGCQLTTVPPGLAGPERLVSEGVRESPPARRKDKPVLIRDSVMI